MILCVDTGEDDVAASPVESKEGDEQHEVKPGTTTGRQVVVVLIGQSVMDVCFSIRRSWQS